MNKKIIMVVIAAIVVIALIIGLVIWINRDNANIQIDINVLGERILESGAFSDELDKIDSEIVMNSYGFTSDEISSLISFQGSGATSEEIVILQVNDKSNLNSVKEKINTRLAERKEAFEDYLPEEVFKIDNHILEVKGKYVIMCISNNSNEVIDTINNYMRE